MRTITSPMNGSQVPVTIDLNVQPLILMNQPVTNGRGEAVMNDRWIYIQDPQWKSNQYSINVWRSRYCEKIYMSQITIREAVGEKKLFDKDLQLFIDKVSDKLVFEKFGRWYRVFLEKKTSRTYGILKVQPYYFSLGLNLKVKGFSHDYLACIDWKQAFYVR